MPFRRTTLLAAATLAWLLAAGPVAADCQPAGPVEDVVPTAPVAFVGTVVAVDGPIAIFAVSEIWAGDVATPVQVRGLVDNVVDPNDGLGAGFIEDDRQWSQGETYLVVPFIDGGVLRDNQCTATTVWRAELEPLRPDDARIVTGEPEAGEPGPFVSVPYELILVGVVVGILVAGATALALRRR